MAAWLYWAIFFATALAVVAVAGRAPPAKKPTKKKKKVSARSRPSPTS
jgi:hypothetical protein